MKDLLVFMAQNLVDHPEDVTVTEVERDNETVLELRVNSEDMGKIIGKQGRIVKEIRTIIKAMSSKSPKRVSVEIVD